MFDMGQSWHIAPPVMTIFFTGLESSFFFESPKKAPLKKGGAEYFVNFFS